jgi:hypothetical protein
MSRWLRLTPLLLVLALLWGGEAVAQRQWPNDVSGRPAPPCTVYDPIANTTTFCSATNPLPVGAPGGGGTGLGTTGGTSVTGFGKAWYPSTYQASGEPTAAVFQDGATVNAFRRNTGCGNCLTVATSTDGGVTFVEVNTSFIVGNTVQFIIKVPSSPARYLGYTPNGASSHIYNSTSIQSGWADGVTASPDLNNGIVDVATNTTGSVVLMVGGVGGGNHTNVCKSTDQGRNFGACVNVRAAVAASGIWYGGGTVWFASSQDGGVSRSTDDGATWTLVQTLGGTGGHGLCTAFTSFATCLNLSGGSVFRSTDNGLTWTNVASGVGSLICDYGAGNIGIFPGTPPVGFAAITNTAFSSQDTLNYYAGNIYGSAWTGVGAPSATVFVCNSTGRGFAGIHTTAGPTPQFNFYNPVTQPGGTLQSSAGGYNVAALIQSGILLNATQTSAATTAQTITLTGVPGSRVCIRRITLFSSTASQNVTLVVQDATVTTLNFGTVSTTATAGNPLDFPGQPVFCGQTGDSLQVVVGAAAAGTTTLSVVADRYPN